MAKQGNPCNQFTGIRCGLVGGRLKPLIRGVEALVFRPVFSLAARPRLAIPARLGLGTLCDGGDWRKLVEPSGIEPLTSCMPCDTDINKINNLSDVARHNPTLFGTKSDAPLSVIFGSSHHPTRLRLDVGGECAGARERAHKTVHFMWLGFYELWKHRSQRLT